MYLLSALLLVLAVLSASLVFEFQQFGTTKARTPLSTPGVTETNTPFAQSSQIASVGPSPTKSSKKALAFNATTGPSPNPTATANPIPIPDATATQIIGTTPTPGQTPTPTPGQTPTPTPTAVPATLTASPSSILVTNTSQYCQVDTHGGYASDMTCTITLSNTSRTTSTLNWSASMTPADYTISPTSGSIAPGKSATFIFYTYSGVTCPATETLVVQGPANAIQIPITCTYLYVNPDQYSFSNSSCTQSGNWTCVLTISSTKDSESISWQITASSTTGVTFSQASGTLAPNSSVQVTITIASTDCPGSNSFSVSGGSLVNPATMGLSFSC